MQAIGDLKDVELPSTLVMEVDPSDWSEAMRVLGKQCQVMGFAYEYYRLTKRDGKLVLLLRPVK